jgi:hypothetical protein
MLGNAQRLIWMAALLAALLLSACGDDGGTGGEGDAGSSSGNGEGTLRDGCEVSCRVAQMCFSSGTEEQVQSCADSCAQGTSSLSEDCKQAVRELGGCVDITCEQFRQGACSSEFTRVNDCMAQDGGT